MSLPPKRPALLPLRLILVGGALACAVLSQAGLSVDAYGRLLAWLPLSVADQSVASPDLVWRTLRSGFVLGIAVGIAHLASMALTLIVDRTGPIGRGIVSVFFAILAFAPIVALSWGFVGWWIGIQHGSIESLLGYTPPPGKDTVALALARVIWRWAAPCLMMALPLTGWLALHRGRDLAALRRNVSDLDLRARGLPPAWIFYHHLLPRLWPVWRRGLEICGVMATALMLVVEDALQFHGVGEMMLTAVRAGDVPAMAQSLYAVFWIIAVGSALVGFVERRDPWRVVGSWNEAKPEGNPSSGSWILRIAVAGFVLAVAWWAGTQLSVEPWAVRFVQQMQQSSGALWIDVRETLAALGLAAGGGLICGALRASRIGGLVRGLAGAETIVWLPLLAAWPALTELAKTYGLPSYVWLALAALGWVVTRLDNAWTAASSPRHIEAAKAIGLGPVKIFFAHILPALTCPWLLASLDVLPWLWVGRIWIASVVPGSVTEGSLGTELAAAQTQILTQPETLLPAATLIVLCALCMALPARILRGIQPH